MLKKSRNDLVELLNVAGLLFTFVFISASITGCASTSMMRSASIEAGESKTFNASFDNVLDAARESVTQSGLEVEEDTQLDDQTWIIICNKGVTGWSWGERARITVQKKSESKTLVRVLTRRKLPTNVTATWDFSPEIFSNIESNLQVVNPIPSATEADQSLKGIKGIVLSDGNVIEGQILNISANAVIIRTKDGKVLSYSFEKEVKGFIKEK
jgi:hypothetical protein